MAPHELSENFKFSDTPMRAFLKLGPPDPGPRVSNVSNLMVVAESEEYAKLTSVKSVFGFEPSSFG